MRSLEILKTAVAALKRNPLRSVLTTLGVVIGVFSVITIVAVGRGAEHLVTQSLKSFGANLVWVMPGNKMFGGARSDAAQVKSLMPEDAKAILKECPDVEDLSPFSITTGSVVAGNQNWTCIVNGTGASFPSVRDWPLDRGAFFTEVDVARANKVCVLGATVVRRLFGLEDPVGKVIRIKQMPFRVLGTLIAKGQTGWGQDQDDVILAPYPTVMKKLSGVTFLNGIQVMARSADSIDIARGQIAELLARRHHIAPGTENDFSTVTAGEILAIVSRIYGTLVAFLGAVASITLFVGGIGIMNIMLVSVTERVREIGIRVALGAKGRDILLQFLLEAVLIAGLGGVLGVIGGLLLAELVSVVLHWPVLVDPVSTSIALGFSGLVGVVFGFFPAWRAAELDPIEALRTE